MSAVKEHNCGAPVYDLRGPDGPVLLDVAAAERPGLYMPDPDGRTCYRAEGDWGFAEHRCVPDGQAGLFGELGAG